jgi:tetratricopeptide (TPR) repeat protein
MNRLIFKISAGFLVGALVLLAFSLSLSRYYVDEQQRLAAAGDVEGAVAMSQRAVNLDPFDTAPLESVSFLYQQQGRAGDAAQALSEAVERSPEYYVPHLMMGNLQLGKIGNFEAAADSYRKVLELNPQAEVASSGLAQSLIRQGKLEEAREVYVELDESGDIPLQGLYDLGRLQVRTGEAEKGTKNIKRARRRAKNEMKKMEGPVKEQRKEFIQSVDLAIADALVVRGRYEQAREVIVASDSPQAPGLLQLLDSDPIGYRDSVVNNEIY